MLLFIQLESLLFGELGRAAPGAIIAILLVEFVEQALLSGHVCLTFLFLVREVVQLLRLFLLAELLSQIEERIFELCNAALLR